MQARRSSERITLATFGEFEAWFSTETACRSYIRRLRWPNGFVCQDCGAVGEPTEMSRGLLGCRACGRQVSLTAGTIFQDTHKPLRQWFLAMWFITSQKNGVSALGLQRVLGLGSYRTAWTWLHKLRRAMIRPGRDDLHGEVEVDETYVGCTGRGRKRPADRSARPLSRSPSRRTVAASAEFGCAASGMCRLIACWPLCAPP